MNDRFQSLDGWRAISIIFVLMGHLLPLGPKAWQLNSAVAAAGMALFFILSGFLITNILLKDRNIVHFLIRRFMRIIPLAWLVLLITLVLTSSGLDLYPSHLLFYANWAPLSLVKPASHFWSLCVEIQFYMGIATLVLVLRGYAFKVLPILCILATAYRYVNDVPIAIDTYYRIDEILAGCVLALLYKNQTSSVKAVFGSINSVYLIPVLILSAHGEGGILNYFRPYIAMLIVGATLFKQEPVWWSQWLNHRVLRYIATISYALYVVHGGLRVTWLGNGEGIEKYMKRPLFFAVTFLLAHISTFYYEKYWIELGKKLIGRKGASQKIIMSDPISPRAGD
jgi:peptidoglycan/LPS O-acetylase OafA/YrhL